MPKCYVIRTLLVLLLLVPSVSVAGGSEPQTFTAKLAHLSHIYINIYIYIYMVYTKEWCGFKS